MLLIIENNFWAYSYFCVIQTKFISAEFSFLSYNVSWILKSILKSKLLILLITDGIIWLTLFWPKLRRYRGTFLWLSPMYSTPPKCALKLYPYCDTLIFCKNLSMGMIQKILKIHMHYCTCWLGLFLPQLLFSVNFSVILTLK